MVFAADEFRTAQAHQVGDDGNAGGRACGDGDWHQHHFVPLRVLVDPIRIRGKPCSLVLTQQRNQIADVGESIVVVGAQRSYEGALVVIFFILFKERLKAVRREHDNRRGSLEQIGRGLKTAVLTAEGDTD